MCRCRRMDRAQDRSGARQNVSDERNRFDGGVGSEFVKPAGFKRIHPGIIPNIGSVAPVPAEFDVIDMGHATDFEYGDEFVFGAVKRSHATVVLVPDAQIEKSVIERAPGGEELEQMPPVHANVMQGAVTGRVHGEAKSG